MLSGLCSTMMAARCLILDTVDFTHEGRARFRGRVHASPILALSQGECHSWEVVCGHCIVVADHQKRRPDCVARSYNNHDASERSDCGEPIIGCRGICVTTIHRSFKLTASSDVREARCSSGLPAEEDIMIFVSVNLETVKVDDLRTLFIKRIF